MSHSNDTPSFQLDGHTVTYEPGETVLQAAHRAGVEIPTLCWDERLSSAGACRLCLVEVEGARRLEPACKLPARNDLVVDTRSEKVARNRRFVLDLHLADVADAEHALDRAAFEDTAPSRLHALAEQYGADAVARGAWPAVDTVRANRPDDVNPYIGFRAERCINCSLCTRYCDEIEAVSAITMAGRGAETTVSTADRLSLEQTTCEMCGGCVAVCPTGAMVDKPALAFHEQHGATHRELDTVRTTCNFCGVGCQIDLHVDRSADNSANTTATGVAARGRIAYVTPPEPGTTVNDGNLCVKGRFANDFVHHPERLTSPLVRAEDGTLVPATWDEALQRAVDGLQQVSSEFGADALAFVSSSRCTVEENYLVQKMARAAFRTHNVHQCAAT